MHQRIMSVCLHSLQRNDAGMMYREDIWPSGAVKRRPAFGMTCNGECRTVPCARKPSRVERAARQFAAKLVTSSATGEVDPRGGNIELRSVYRSWLASRPDLSAKVRRGYEDNWKLRIEPRFGSWSIGKIDHESQR
jgi:hypothetical protein